MIETPIDLEHLRRWIGTEQILEEELTAALAEKFHATLGFRGEPPRVGGPAPRLIHFCLCQPATATAVLGTDGHVARGGFLPPVPLPRRMWAGSDVRFSGDLIVGQAVCRRSRVVDVVLKEGKSGSLCFVTVDHHVEADGVLRIEDRQTIAYREGQRSGSALIADTSPASEGEMWRLVRATPALLFRYSALTFNTHRIHYDRPYAKQEEGYPGLVVHAPLQATLLLHLATECAGGRPPDRFAFRGVSPIFDVEEIRLVAGRGNASRREFWTAPVGGPVAMLAEATWS